jgi:DNA/RNA endonuclease YhcR with UshA esterase domain
LTNAQFTQSGLYYVAVTGGAGTTDSPTNSVLVTLPINVTIAYLHSLMTTNQSGSYDIGAGAYVNVQGVVTSFAPLSSATATNGEYYIQDGTSGIFVYVYHQGSNSVPPAGALVSVTGPCQVYNGQLEIDPDLSGNAVTNSVSVLSYNNPLPASQPLNFALMVTNSLGAYGIQIQNSLVTVTNVYIYSSKTGGAVGGNFATNKATTLYMTAQPYAVGIKYLTLYVYGVNGEATNFWGQLIPGQACEITGVMGQFYSTPELYPTRYVDIVTNLPAPFVVSMAQTNGVSQLNWPTVTGSTYSVYSATNITGPWTQTFGLGYFPSSGVYTQTNPAAIQFYKVSSP